MIGTAIGLTGAGLLYLFPEVRWIGWTSVISGVSLAVMATIWALAYSHARKQFQLESRVSAPEPLPPQQQQAHQSVHAPITLNLNQAQNKTLDEQNKTPVPDLLDPELELLHWCYVDAVKDNSGRYSQASNASTFSRKAAWLDFDLRAIRNSVPWVEVRAQIIFNNAQNQRMRVIDGVWHGRDSVEVPFRPGETRSIIVATCLPDQSFSTYEHAGHKASPTERVLDQSIRAQVRLIGRYMDIVRFNEFWCFKLSSTVEPKITKITPEEFERAL